MTDTGFFFVQIPTILHLYLTLALKRKSSACTVLTSNGLKNQEIRGTPPPPHKPLQGRRQPHWSHAKAVRRTVVDWIPGFWSQLSWHVASQRAGLDVRAAGGAVGRPADWPGHPRYEPGVLLWLTLFCFVFRVLACRSLDAFVKDLYWYPGGS